MCGDPLPPVGWEEILKAISVCRSGAWKRLEFVQNGGICNSREAVRFYYRDQLLTDEQLGF